jgi:hypothetical protein
VPQEEKDRVEAKQNLNRYHDYENKRNYRIC